VRLAVSLALAAIGCGAGRHVSAFDPAAATRSHQHARIAAFRTVRLVATDPPLRDHPEDDSSHPTVTVIDQADGLMQIAVDQDGVDLAVWIDARDAAATLVSDVRLQDDHDQPLDVWLAAGTDVDVIGEQVGRRLVATRDAAVRVEGWVPADRVDTIWTGQIMPDREPHADTAIAAHQPIRSRPDASAPMIAETRTQIRGGHAGSSPWQELEVTSGGIRVHGFVQRDGLDPATLDAGRGRTRSFESITDIGCFTLAAGTQLYAHADGDVIGRVRTTAPRYGIRGDTWSRVLVRTGWGDLPVVVRSVDLPAASVSPHDCAH
jgi:hypothetical protein